MQKKAPNLQTIFLFYLYFFNNIDTLFPRGDKQTAIATYRLNLPKGRLSENLCRYSHISDSR